MQSVTVRELAKKLSVSPSTVSKTLTGNYGGGNISITTAKKILDYCFAHGYIDKARKDSILLKMQVQVSEKRVFCLSCYENLWGYNAVFAAISKSLQSYGQFTSFFTAKSKEEISRFPYESTSAVIVFGRILPDVHKALQDSNVPMVLIDNYINESASSTINSDNLGSFSRAVELLNSLGHKRIAFVCRHEDHPRRTYNLHQRQSGYIVGMANAGLDWTNLLITEDYAHEANIEYETVIKELRDLALRLISLNPMPTAVLAANDLTAHVLRTVLVEKGFRVPEDVSVIGYDGQHRISGALGFKPVSTMIVNWLEMGRSAVDLATELIIDPKLAPRHIVIPTEYENMGTVGLVKK